MPPREEFVRKIKGPVHGILFYRDAVEKWGTLNEFVKAGINRGERVIYVAGEEPPERIREVMLHYDLDIMEVEREGQLKIMNYDKVYIVDSRVEIPKILKRWKMAFEEALEVGFRGLRVCGEAECFFTNNLVEELIEYEKAIGRKPKFPMEALCVYSLHRLDFLKETSIYEIVKSHGCIISPSFAGEVAFESLYLQTAYKKLEEIFKEKTAEAILNFMKTNYSMGDTVSVDRVKGLYRLLKNLLGSRAADIIDQHIWRKICQELGVII